MSGVIPDLSLPNRAGATPPADPDDTAPQPAPRRSAATLIDQWGLWVAPLLIAGLAGLLALYHRSLDLENAVRQQRSALSWSDKLWPQTLQHLEIAAYSTLLVVVIAIPLGILLTRPAFRRVAPTLMTVANSGQAFPAYGLLVGGLFLLGNGTATVVYCLALFALLPVLRNTMVGLDGVDRNVIEAGRGMGMTRRLVLTRIELPLAVPVILAGVRTAMVLNIGMATLAFLIGGGALGITISSGLKLNQDPVLIVGAVMVAIVALTFDWLGAVAERYLRPRGL
ncbi:ABC transporter permease [Nocardioides sp. 31GB23]|uniref:Osmoprotectant transport system permease protein n=1 Tax=Nocardioides salarius TaxID=374513 RepID=A0ABS2MCR3_9ACTN|nr:ABC transporter permease [Nocardioides salarius]MBM7508991.1 osmoprotectant transport system permease protein [Nocardioides salarius]